MKYCINAVRKRLGESRYLKHTGKGGNAVGSVDGICETLVQVGVVGEQLQLKGRQKANEIPLQLTLMTGEERQKYEVFTHGSCEWRQHALLPVIDKHYTAMSVVLVNS